MQMNWQLICQNGSEKQTKNRKGNARSAREKQKVNKRNVETDEKKIQESVAEQKES